MRVIKDMGFKNSGYDDGSQFRAISQRKYFTFFTFQQGWVTVASMALTGLLMSFQPCHFNQVAQLYYGLRNLLYVYVCPVNVLLAHPIMDRKKLSVVDPGFSEEGVLTLKEAIFWPFFPKNCMKLKEFGPSGGHASWRPPLIHQWLYIVCKIYLGSELVCREMDRKVNSIKNNNLKIFCKGVV